ncbi:putative 3'-5' exonuclease [Lyophyllum shimeji]|uniref:3'-5' exonuclease n=1 Tax=Lyophyllum shimeji TaxID=47721 RepID=A0A9P3UQ81_LYOSH|nr:putative 3'-5' exonuclease [Lyophyllum shimeji]
MQSHLSADYIYCDTPAALESALPTLRSSPALSFDCEGHNLGRLNGSLSLLTFRTMFPSPDATNTTFIIDALTLPASSLLPIFSLLESDTVLKVVFDGRMDFSCLLHQHAVRLQHVLDLQLVDIASRARRGEGEHAQMARLARVVSWADLAANRGAYRSIHRLAGLRPCAEEHKVAIPPRGAYMDHSAWLQRPLSARELTYAANDVLIISRVYAAFAAAAYLERYPSVLADSMRYISLWADRPPAEGALERYRSHGLLPLHVIDVDTEAEDQERDRDVALRVCGYCERALPQTCFRADVWDRGDVRQCLVCRAVGLFHPRFDAARAGLRWPPRV